MNAEVLEGLLEVWDVCPHLPLENLEQTDNRQPRAMEGKGEKIGGGGGGRGCYPCSDNKICGSAIGMNCPRASKSHCQKQEHMIDHARLHQLNAECTEARSQDSQIKKCVNHKHATQSSESHCSVIHLRDDTAE